ncbi:MAG: phosphatidylserine decarboxylase family protein [Saprospiraceae bacterium]|nr:phosphatidylserine decarboxylase family protein [Saprospiraceae bacterium]
MSIHREGTSTLIISAVVLAVLNGLSYAYLPSMWLMCLLISLILYIFLISFFRKPDRSISSIDDTIFLCPCDGKVVVIEETEEPEYFKDKRLQVSIFMSPLNVHINWHPISGTIDYYKYHPGKYLAAWNPKSSTENERTTTVYNYGNEKLLVRQVAGALARRIVCYAQKRQVVKQGDELGFIKFGSRVDLYFPLGTDIQVNIGDKVQGNITKLAKV